MVHTADECLRQYMKVSRAFREQIRRDPEHAKRFLLDAGILVRTKSKPSGVMLAKRFRSTDQP